MTPVTRTRKSLTVVERDTVVDYDVMRETATRLVGAYAALLPAESSDPAHHSGMQRMIAVRRAARSVPTRDSAAIAAATARFHRELQQLRTR
ncbi:hypothetical protein [Rathayibacter toxicus]|uniref:Uncharacterized protein n=1 Tax=Rathayibacter toxicus TaxID=145458 RepID=A0A0C5BRM7_9MICO|nr:hypothetical protein [Rathayibacter toxicus]AJM77322.1 hypothetical protein TI83_03830 [Rathayibacter toxicus]ALS56804.1 hypothetical protein APU90_02640 [Rathayibacter toxicus]KKM46349.1 hypothetical protein VT73_04855 [Rathayibacter toxicus]PPG23335.1 hypothetical protein C5D15_03630 [Rathayibacter toxicus]PPG47919.1 hypothetical protein C5D16_03630 [Rathayibacter toxicus]